MAVLKLCMAHDVMHIVSSTFDAKKRNIASLKKDNTRPRPNGLG